MVQKNTGGKYPAPFGLLLCSMRINIDSLEPAHNSLCFPSGFQVTVILAILRSVETGINSGVDRGSKVEAEEFGRLALTQESAALISLFFAQTSLKKNRSVY